jgi:hypothetical protein
MVQPEERVIQCGVCKVAMANRVYKKFGTMLGKSKGKYPYFDTQLGLSVESPQHRDRVAKERGLVTMGKEEWERSRNASRSPDPMDSNEVDPNLIECAKRAWDDVTFGRVPDEKERVMDIAKTVEADFLDATPAKEPS